VLRVRSVLDGMDSVAVKLPGPSRIPMPCGGESQYPHGIYLVLRPHVRDAARRDGNTLISVRYPQQRYRVRFERY